MIVVDGEEQLEYLSIITALMAPYYALLDKIVSWAVEVGIDRKKAADYTAAMFGALSVMAQALDNGDLERLMQESMTPGGLNDLAMQTINKNGGFDNWKSALRAVQNKVK